MTSGVTADEEFMDLRQLIDKLWARRVWLAACTFVFIAASVAYALSSERIFRATTILAPADSGGMGAMNSALGQIGGLASLAGISIGSSSANTEEALAVLRSREFTVSFFEAENVVPKIFHEEWDSQAKTWKAGVTPPTVSRAFVYFDSRIRAVIQNRKTGLVSLQIEWRDREEAAHWANQLVKRLNDEMRTRAIVEANTSLQFLKKELEGTSEVATREAINRLIEGQIKQRMLANVNQEYAFRVIDRAVVPEADEAVRPRRQRIVLIGALLGFLLAAVTTIAADYLRAPRNEMGARHR